MMEILIDIISFIVSLIDFISLIADVIPLVENSLSIIAILSAFFYFIYRRLSQIKFCIFSKPYIKKYNLVD